MVEEAATNADSFENVTLYGNGGIINDFSWKSTYMKVLVRLYVVGPVRTDERTVRPSTTRQDR